MSVSNTVTKNDLKTILESISMPKSERRVLLWTNPSPSTEYGSGNPVSASIATQYDFIEIAFLLWTGYQYICCIDRAALGESVITTEVASSNNYAVDSQICPLARSWDFSSANGVRIYGGVQANFASGGTWQTANQVLIPYKIYGVKGSSTWTPAIINIPQYQESDSTDETLYNAIVALNWQNDVIV